SFALPCNLTDALREGEAPAEPQHARPGRQMRRCVTTGDSAQREIPDNWQTAKLSVLRLP
ncbi:MAG: hypothetical protein ACK5YO_31595, partial [Planctomyces sp.]